MIIKAKTGFELSWASIFYPFNSSLWVALIASMLLLSSCLAIVYQTFHHYKGLRRNGLLQNIYNSSFFIFSVFCGQGIYNTILVTCL